MTIERKAFKAIYELVRSGCATERQAYDMCVAVFWQPPMYIQTDSMTDEQQQPSPTPLVVKGFAGDEKRAQNGP